MKPEKSELDSWASSPGVRAVMRGNRRRDTQPEMKIRHLLHALGFRYLVDAAPLKSSRRRADLVFRGPQVAVFIDGCFWHACPQHGMIPSTNTTFWSEKLGRNQERDLETNELMTKAGWLPLRFWEHDNPTEVVAAVAKAVGRRRPE